MPTAPDGLPEVLHHTALLAGGFTDDEIRTSRRSGQWVALHRGTYCAADAVAALKYEQLHRLRAWAIASRSPHLVVSHVSAAAVLGLPIWGVSLERVHLTRIGQGGGRVSPGRVVHAVPLKPSEIIEVDGTRVTTVARTLVDVACSSPLPTTVIAGDAALRRGLVTPAELALAVARTRHRRGAAAARRALSFADRRSESAGESRARLILSAQGLPEPVLQIRIYDRAGVLVGRVDLGYPGLGVLIEFDGMVKYPEASPAGSATGRGRHRGEAARGSPAVARIYRRPLRVVRPCRPRRHGNHRTSRPGAGSQDRPGRWAGRLMGRGSR